MWCVFHHLQQQQHHHQHHHHHNNINIVSFPLYLIFWSKFKLQYDEVEETKKNRRLYRPREAKLQNIRSEIKWKRVRVIARQSYCKANGLLCLSLFRPLYFTQCFIDDNTNEVHNTNTNTHSHNSHILWNRNEKHLKIKTSIAPSRHPQTFQHEEYTVHNSKCFEFKREIYLYKQMLSIFNMMSLMKQPNNRS